MKLFVTRSLFKVIILLQRSDTVTKPCLGMRRAMAEAKVGDDVFGDDPTVIELQSTVAKLLNKDAGLFVPTGFYHIETQKL